MARAKHIDVPKEVYLEVIAHLDNGGTKKAACEMLGIAYNTKRLDNLIEEFLERESRDKKFRAQKRKEAVTDSEVVNWITSYLNGATLSELSSSYYRSENVIKYHLEKHGAMLRQPKVDKLNPPVLPDLCISDTFEVGQYVWSTAYNCIAIVKAKVGDMAYRIHVLGNGIQEYSNQPAWELGNLAHLEKLGVNLSSFEDYMRSDEVKMAIYETMLKANKREKENARK